ncbi:MAG: hypothetical protein Q4E12_08340 [Coriobacteriia bacterium]|nr:hypothetical protein [Coriobacteriia bacterium]
MYTFVLNIVIGIAFVLWGLYSLITGKTTNQAHFETSYQKDPARFTLATRIMGLFFLLGGAAFIVAQLSGGVEMTGATWWIADIAGTVLLIVGVIVWRVMIPSNKA